MIKVNNNQFYIFRSFHNNKKLKYNFKYYTLNLISQTNIPEKTSTHTNILILVSLHYFIIRMYVSAYCSALLVRMTLVIHINCNLQVTANIIVLSEY